MKKVEPLKIPFIQKDQIPMSFINKEIPSSGTILAADVGGTKTNLALFKIADAHLELIAEKTYQTKSYKSFTDLFHKFRDEHHPEIDAISLAVAGPVINGNVQGTNFPWLINGKELSKTLNVKSVFVINDLEASAYGMTTLGKDDFETLIEGEGMSGNAGIVAPGTGLGEAGLFWDGNTYHPFASEGGHCSFSPLNQLDVDLFNFMFEKYGDVSWERLVSGQGIIDIHNFLRAQSAVPVPEWFKQKWDKEDPAVVITTAGLEKNDTVCTETLEVFFRFLAIEASQLALKMKAFGGIFIGGGIVPKIIEGIDKEAFTTNFVQSGRMASLLKMMPVKVILNEKTPLYGAAIYGAMGIQN